MDKKKAKEVYNDEKVSSTLASLLSRWQNEYEYLDNLMGEDWTLYEASIRKVVEAHKDVTMTRTRSNRKNIWVHFTCYDHSYEIRLTKGGYYSIKQLS